MNIATMQKINQIGKYFILAIVILNLVGENYAQGTGGATGGVGNFASTLKDFCTNFLKPVFGVGLVLLVITAALTYAIGQLLGAETRARATVWSTAMITGAIIAALIYIVLPFFINGIIGQNAGSLSVSAGVC